MRKADVKINTDYYFNNQSVRVVKRIKNRRKERWYYGFGKKYQVITENFETSFLLSNGLECYARDLTK